MTPAYPFRFYGADPSEWEGELCSYEVHFLAIPGDAERIAVARAFEASLVGTSVDARGHEIRWAAEWALFRVEPKRLGMDFDWGIFFEDIRSAFEAVHRVVPIEEVVFLELIDLAETGHRSGGDWHGWSIAQKAVPGDAPTWGTKLPWLESLFSAKQKRYAVPTSEDPAAEAARHDVREAANREVTEAKDAAVAEARIVFAIRDEEPPLPAHFHSRGLWRRAGIGFCETRAPEGAWLYAQREADPTTRESAKKSAKNASSDRGASWELFLGSDRQLDRFEPTVKARDFRWTYGSSGLFLWDGTAILRADLATRHVVRWMSLDTPVLSMAALAGALAVLTEKELVVYEVDDGPADDERRRLATMTVAGKGAIDAMLDGRVLGIHANAVWGDQTILLAYESGQFWLLGASHERLELIWEARGAVFAARDDERSYVEILNLDVARREAMRRPPATALDLATSEATYTAAPTDVCPAIEVVEDDGV